MSNDIMTAIDKSRLAKLMAKETFKLLLDSSRLLKDESALDRKTAVLFMAEFLVLVLDDVLNDEPLGLEGSALYDHVHKAYTETKGDVENKIGLAFMVAVHKFSGKKLMYGCEILPIPYPDKEKDC